MKNYSHRFRIFITGAAEFLGSQLYERLLNVGYYFISLDNFSTDTKDSKPICWIIHTSN